MQVFVICFSVRLKSVCRSLPELRHHELAAVIVAAAVRVWKEKYTQQITSFPCVYSFINQNIPASNTVYRRT